MSRASQVLLGVAAVNFAVALVALVVEGPTPSTVLYPILLAVGGWRVVRGSGGAVFLLVVAAVMLGVHVPFVTQAASGSCVHPLNTARSCNEALWLVWLGVAPLALAIAAVVAWREQRRGA